MDHQLIEQIMNDLTRLKKTKPTILNITNHVTMEFMANTLLTIGAAPIMSLAKEEIEEIIKISNSININIGTLTTDFSELAIKAAEIAKKSHKKIILDPVGVGASKMRKQLAQEIIIYTDIIRGNATEIIALNNNNSVQSCGVESNNHTYEAKNAARALARKYKVTVAVTGKKDFITDGDRETEMSYGNKLMTKITGMGCSLSAVIAAFSTINNDSFLSTCSAVGYFSLAGTLVNDNNLSPEKFRIEFLDCLYRLNLQKYKNINSLENEYEI